jgi:hypothetical protein
MGLDTGLGGGLLPLVLLLGSGFMNLIYISFEKKCPSYKAARIAYRKKLQFAWIHAFNGTVTGEIVDGVKLPHKAMNKAEYIDNRLPTYHYIRDIEDMFPNAIDANLTFAQKMNANRQKRLQERKDKKLSKKGIQPQVQQSQIIKQSQSQPQQSQSVMKRVDASGAMGTTIWTDASDFLYGVSMSAAGSLSEWKSYVSVLAKGEIQNKSILQLDAKTIGTILIFAGIALVISKAGSMGSVINT